MEKFLSYITINKLNGKCYVGSHLQLFEDDGYIGSGTLLKYAIIKHGKKNFLRIELNIYNDIFEARKSEEYYIKLFDSLTPNGYNISPSGGMGKNNFGKHSEQSKKKQSISQIKRFENIKEREKISIRFKGKTYIELYGEEKANELKNKRKIVFLENNPNKGGEKSINFGRHHTIETRLKQSNIAKNKPKSEEHKKSLSKAWEKRKIEKPFTDETKNKMRQSMIGKNVGKYIKIYEFKGPDNKIYESSKGLVKFAKSVCIHPGSFRELIQGKIKEYHGWTYIQTIKE